jgi:hypothetical protein
MPRSRRSVDERMAEGRQAARAALAEVEAAQAAPAPAPGPVAPGPVHQPPRPRSWLPSYAKALILPPELVRRTYGGIIVTVWSAGRLAQHIASAVPADVTIVEVASRGRRPAEVRQVPYRSDAWCRTCLRHDCEGARYALAILPLYLPEPIGATETA